MFFQQIRRYSVQVAAEIVNCVREGGPVVALESTIISHGLPYPANLEMAQSVEQLVRAHGAVPATVGFVNGVAKVGLSQADLEAMARPGEKYKVSRRDIPYVMARQLTGGTTIAATMILAHRAGIDVFATGGLGGVSRPFELMDVSADLDELSKTPVAVVCSGPKSILDVARTMEYLETKGVPVATLGDGQKTMNVPGFYTRDSGVASPFVLGNTLEAARLVHSGKDAMRLENGYVFCVPPPADIALPAEYINRVIAQTQQEAEQLGVSGKQLTPFMLGRINEKTDGLSVKCNIEFVRNNAVVGSKIAAELAQLRSSFQPVHQSTRNPAPQPVQETAQKPARAVVVGSVALDSTSTVSTVNFHDSCPGKTEYSVGGVGFNVALAAAAVGGPQHVALVSGLNQADFAGKTVMAAFAECGLRTDGLIDLAGRTAQYTSVHDHRGELVIACADMAIVEQLAPQHVVAKLEQLDPNYVLMDTNVSEAVMDAVFDSCNGTTRVVVEPTSGAKARKLAQTTKLGCFPDNRVHLITPTVLELESLYDAFYAAGRFEAVSSWFNVLDSLNINSALRNRLEKQPMARKYLEKGVLQQAFQLLPYFPAILVKDGCNGVVLVEIVGSETAEDAQSAAFSVLHRGRNGLGLLVSHYPAQKIEEKSIKSVTGAGDSLAGYLLARLAQTRGLPFAAERGALVDGAQRAAVASLQTTQAVNYGALARAIT
ncbi:hypothetical protein KL918_004919 [Ogataea parapolymorpha]|uniref:Carbohydrate kinase PfkB domain-containing protein n=1 Tax=Ogataea parapolymorpha (strain ATCC 26012 / BCRC 20466 / JCM 22074 / NRRL Y-7560 / DL-1) TaxID=871575 RepID=W1QF01_OGAPD|nr:hypothetical protein HPODL_01016 [Ogataea parapolymorpha DL-1]ESX00133.1 hypothetical protein HPODL_01016 [Ogataea parapolymorpha DL-1]KAG7865043.1 hypothetical protein KL918_004919 [Ogataea parapolymorpha]KAG7872272.1 hypothetical protein KL916_003295 [Ogataea parapolymorpha]